MDGFFFQGQIRKILASCSWIFFDVFVLGSFNQRLKEYERWYCNIFVCVEYVNQSAWPDWAILEKSMTNF